MMRRFAWWAPALMLLLMLPAILPLAAPGYFFRAHDAHHSVFFLVEFDQSLRDQFPWPVWSPDHALGFGYPLWLVYAPLSYYVAEAFHLLGLGYTAAVKATWAFCFLLGAAGIYRLARRWWGPAAAVTASLAYTYAPYHLVQIYVRAALAEFAALAWFPWAILAFVTLWDDPRPRRAALAASALGVLLLLHTVSALIFVPILLAWIALEAGRRWWRARKPGPSSESDAGASGRVPGRGALWSAAALLLGGLLAAIFWVPMFVERAYIVESQWVASTYNYALHFVYPAQFFNPEWGYGYSVPGPGDGMSFQLGIVIFVAAVVGALAAVGPGLRSSGAAARQGDAEPSAGECLPHRTEALFLAAVALLAVFAMTPAARPLWDTLPLVSLVQFPWRLLAVAVTALSLLVGVAVRGLGPSASAARPDPFGLVLALAIVLAGYPYARPELQPIRPEDESPIAVMEFELAYPDMRGMVAWSQRQPAEGDSPLVQQYLAGRPLQRAAIVSGSGSILEQGSRAASAYARVRADGEVRLRFYTYYFPGWRATVDGAPAEITPDPPNGLIGLTLPPGEHEVRLRFGPTPVRRVASAVSLLALAGVGLLLLADRHRRSRDLPNPAAVC